MKTKTIKKSLEISAPKENVWDVLINDKFTRAWYAVFSQGTHAETDWKVGSKATFTDDSHSGLIGKIIENKPNEILSIEYEGMVVDGLEDYDSEIARSIKGGREIYQLSGNNSSTHLSISCDMSEDYFESMSLAWDKALLKISELAVGNNNPRSN